MVLAPLGRGPGSDPLPSSSIVTTEKRVVTLSSSRQRRPDRLWPSFKQVVR
jgi:hypothetical protein